MSSNYTERAFEDAIEHHLVTTGGWHQVPPTAFDRERALIPSEVFAFIAATQSALWNELRAQHGAGLEAAVLDTLTKAQVTRGTLDVLRHGFKFFGKTLSLATFKPAHGLNPEVLAAYAENRLAVTRQARFASSGDQDADQSVDMLLTLNGLPIATVELKNPLTHQTVQHAIAQYRARDPRHRLFQFKRGALVHFAVDPDLAYMATFLCGEGTTFLPFNRGAHGGAGNPEHPSGYRTAYLWEEVWQRDSFLDIVGRFLHLAKEEKLRAGKKVDEEKIVFPRYHQLDAVRRLEAAARVDGPGHSYLIQHSAGVGEVEQHRVARASAVQPARRQGRPRLRLRRGHHRPAGPRQAAPGQHLPVRAQTGRRREDRRALRPARQGARGRHADHHHDSAKVPGHPGQDRTVEEQALRARRGRSSQLADR